jgi:hypothetical protein
MQSLEQAITLARHGKSVSLVRAARALDGCPLGNWAETQQARLHLAGYLPPRSSRSYTIDQWIDAMYAVSPANRYAETI